MKSCWIVKFKDGKIKLYSEQDYKKEWKERLNNVLVEEHWFDTAKAKDTYRDKISSN